MANQGHFLESLLYLLLKIVQVCSNSIKINQIIAKPKIVMDFENILFCKISKIQRIAKMSQVGEFTLCLLFFPPTNIFLCSA